MNNIGATGSGGGGTNGGGGAGGHQWITYSSPATPLPRFSGSSIRIQQPQEYYGISKTQKCPDCNQEFTQYPHNCMAGLKNILEEIFEEENNI